MNKILKNKKFLIALVVVYLIILGGIIFLSARPISYNMEYHGVREDEYGYFEGTQLFRRDDIYIVENTNYELPISSFYYYKDGYVFSLSAPTREYCEIEIGYINNDWEYALTKDFYAKEINAFRLISVRPTGEETIFYCETVLALTITAGVIDLGILGLIIYSIVLNVNDKKKGAVVVEE